MKIGYARVSTNDQNLDLQTDALKAAGCKKIFSDHGVSGAKAERPGLDEALDRIRKKDTTWKERADYWAYLPCFVRQNSCHNQDVKIRRDL